MSTARTPACELFAVWRLWFHGWREDSYETSRGHGNWWKSLVSWVNNSLLRFAQWGSEWWHASFLVGGFNPVEKYQSKWNLPQVGVKIKSVWNHQPVFFCSNQHDSRSVADPDEGLKWWTTSTLLPEWSDPPAETFFLNEGWWRDQWATRIFMVLFQLIAKGWVEFSYIACTFLWLRLMILFAWLSKLPRTSKQFIFMFLHAIRQPVFVQPLASLIHNIIPKQQIFL